MRKITTTRFDIAKQVFQLNGADKVDRAVLRRKLTRNEGCGFFSELGSRAWLASRPAGARIYWARVLTGFDHTVRLMAPQFVQAICEVPEERRRR